jgi:hypothetical protein
MMSSRGPGANGAPALYGLSELEKVREGLKSKAANNQAQRSVRISVILTADYGDNGAPLLAWGAIVAGACRHMPTAVLSARRLIDAGRLKQTKIEPPRLTAHGRWQHAAVAMTDEPPSPSTLPRSWPRAAFSTR